MSRVCCPYCRVKINIRDAFIIVTESGASQLLADSVTVM